MSHNENDINKEPVTPINTMPPLFPIVLASSQPHLQTPAKPKGTFTETIFRPASEIGRKSSVKRNNSNTEQASKQVTSPVQASDSTFIALAEPVRLTKAEKKERKSANKAERLASEGKVLAPPKKKDPVPVKNPSLVETPTRAVSFSKAVSSVKSTSIDQLRPAPKQIKKQKAKGNNSKSGSLFAHLADSLLKSQKVELLDAKVQSGQIHPAVHCLGLKYADFSLSGGNARCLAMLITFKKVIADYVTPEDLLLSRHLTTHIGKQIDFLNTTRSLATSMKTAIRHLKNDIVTIDLTTTTDEAAKVELIRRIDLFIETRILRAMDYIADLAIEKIADGDIILTFANSSTVQTVLEKAYTDGKKFSVICVDSRPKYEGKKMMDAMLKMDIPCTYMTFNAIGVAMRMVIVGASAVFANGAVMSRAGTAGVCMMANINKVPVIIVAESYKFSNAVRLDSYVWNELGDQGEVIDLSKQLMDPILSGWEDMGGLNVLNLNYDLTPAKFITMIICEASMGRVPATSAGTILREMHGEIAH